MATAALRRHRPSSDRTLVGLDRGAVLERIALALTSTLELGEALNMLSQITLEATLGDRCSVFLMEGHTLKPAAALGTQADGDLWPAFRSMGAIDLDEIPGAWELMLLGRPVALEDAPNSPLVPEAWVKRFCLQRVVLVPLVVAGEPCGLMVVDYRVPNRFSDDEVRLLEAIGCYAGVAVRNAGLFQTASNQLKSLEVLHHLHGALAERTNADGLVASLNDLLEGHGISVAQLLFTDRDLRSRLHGRQPNRDQWSAIRSAQSCVEMGEDLLVPMRLGRRLVGAMIVRPSDLRTADRSFLETLAGGVADVANRGALRARLEEAKRERAVAAERERIAADLHDTAGQTFIAIGLLTKRHLEELPEGSPWHQRLTRIVELSGDGKWEIDQTIRALAFFPAARKGIVPSVHKLAETFTEDSGIDALVEVYGEQRRLPLKVERALYRVAHEALVNAWSHACCSSVRIELSFENRCVLMSVVDDGIGLLVQNDKVGRRMGLLSMRRSIEEVGGTLQVRDSEPRGVRVEVQVPLEDG